MFGNLFTKKAKVTNLKVGDEYFIEEIDNNPFEKYIAYATILDVKDGWVQYKMCRKNEKTIFNPSALEISSFLSMYSKVKND